VSPVKSTRALDDGRGAAHVLRALGRERQVGRFRIDGRNWGRARNLSGPMRRKRPSRREQDLAADLAGRSLAGREERGDAQEAAPPPAAPPESGRGSRRARAAAPPPPAASPPRDRADRWRSDGSRARTAPASESFKQSSRAGPRLSGFEGRTRDAARADDQRAEGLAPGELRRKRPSGPGAFTGWPLAAPRSANARACASFCEPPRAITSSLITASQRRPSCWSSSGPPAAAARWPAARAAASPDNEQLRAHSRRLAGDQDQPRPELLRERQHGLQLHRLGVAAPEPQRRPQERARAPTCAPSTPP